MRSTLGRGLMLCIEADMTSSRYESRCIQLGQLPALHRKQWEFVVILEALDSRGLLWPGRRGLGFGTGGEPLPALFANCGCPVLATDLARDQPAAQAWIDTDQHASGREQPPLVTYRDVDMNQIPVELQRGEFDFVWSACALEHLGSIDLGLRFIVEAMRCLKPGGWAIHTTEFNVGSDEQTLEDGATVIFRRRDLVRLPKMLESLGRMEPFDFTTGSGVADLHVDAPPYAMPHLKLQIAQFTSTSVALMVQRT